MSEDAPKDLSRAPSLEATLLRIDRALAWREADPRWSDLSQRDGAFRAFNGFVEGDPTTVLEVFGTTLVLYDHGVSPEGDGPRARAVVERLFSRWPWLRSALWKVRRGEDPALRNGRILRGERGDLPTAIREGGVWYAVDLTMNRDASLYVDAASVRAWLRAHSDGRAVLNLFAYTGSLGVAARAGGASRVVQVDRSGRFLSMATRSHERNGWGAPPRGALWVEDFFRAVARLKSQGRLFDTLVLDPPFFSETSAGTVDLEGDPTRLLNKVRPLLAHGGRIVLINNALWMPGARWISAIDEICRDGYLTRREVLAVDAFSRGRSLADEAPWWPTDPSPFDHPTKILVLEARRRDERRAG